MLLNGIFATKYLEWIWKWNTVNSHYNRTLLFHQLALLSPIDAAVAAAHVVDPNTQQDVLPLGRCHNRQDMLNHCGAPSSISRRLITPPLLPPSPLQSPTVQKEEETVAMEEKAVGWTKRQEKEKELAGWWGGEDWWGRLSGQTMSNRWKQ